MKKLTLNVPERLLLPQLLPKSGKMIEMEVVRNIRDRVRLTPKEIEEYQIKDLANGKVSWDKNELREFRFEDSEIEVMKKGVKACDLTGAITLDNMDLAKRIQALKTKEE